jgi:ribosomal protein S18 acetylase RimI-like enzyme
MAALRASFDDPAQRILVADDGDGLVGSIIVIDKGDGAAGLSMLAVDPARQAGGLGNRLLDAAEAYAAAHFGARTIHMTVIKQRPALIDYYVRRGYRLTGTEEPFPNDERFGRPVARDLVFVALVKAA